MPGATMMWSATDLMKQPDRATESFEFNIGRAPSLRCVVDLEHNATTCGQCEHCQLGAQLASVEVWLHRAGVKSRRRFFVGLLKEVHSPELLRHLTRLLQPLLTSKDFMYARSRSKTSVAGDSATTACDRALEHQTTERSMSSTWQWFSRAPYWSKANFLLALLQRCEYHELLNIANQASTLLAAETMAYKPQDDYESSSLSSSELWSSPRDLPSEADHSAASSPTEDPACLVHPSSSMALLGVAAHKDFIRLLPVHLSKYILALAGRATRHNCLCVSEVWKHLVEEVDAETYHQQQLWEQVMLMEGAAACGCNPLYAKDIDVAVPNLVPRSFNVQRDWSVEEPSRWGGEGESLKKASLETAYAGVSTRKIIMEERNVYCGPYNVLVLLSQKEKARVLHTDGGRLIASTASDKKIHLVDTKTGEYVPPAPSGHSGSVHCVMIREKERFVISGSMDTSIRRWSLDTGKCQKIYHGHQGTVLCLNSYEGLLVSGAKDKTCRVWNLMSGATLNIFKHHAPVTAVAIQPETCVSCCQAGKVNVWDLNHGQLIKTLTGHSAPVTAVCFDRWHIVTSSKDGYVLAWSAVGDLTHCISALRHPKEVLCMAFMYLRVITGAADGKLRIWNMLSGQCLRIMRGNSGCDPITHLVAIDNRITINTLNNVLQLNFEPVEYVYTEDSDTIPQLIKFNSYSDAPVRQQPYTRVRAHRMQLAGATDQRILHHGPARPSQQVAHSAKSLREESLSAARSIHSARTRPASQRSRLSSARPVSGRSVVEGSVKGEDEEEVPPAPSETEGSERGECEQVGSQRRVSWAYQHPLAATLYNLTLTNTKTKLRSEIRAKPKKGKKQIYLVSGVQSMLTMGKKGMDMRKDDDRVARSGRPKSRPASSPSHFDPRRKAAIASWLQSTVEDQADEDAPRPDLSTPPTQPLATSVTIATDFTSQEKSSHSPSRPNSSIPRPYVLRPHSAAIVGRRPPNSVLTSLVPRPKTCHAREQARELLDHVRPPSAVKEDTPSTTGPPALHVPMLMYPADMKDVLASLKDRRARRVRPQSEPRHVTVQEGGRHAQRRIKSSKPR